MDFAWTEDQLALKGAVVRFAEQALNYEVADRDRNAEFSRDGWNHCAEFGIQGLPAPPEYGGGGSDALSIVCALEGLGYACRDNGLLFSLNAHMWSTVVPLMTFGTPLQKDRYLTKLATGTWIGAHGMSEPDSGSDAYSLRTRAVKKGDRYVLNGTKMFVTNAPVADLVIVFANVDPAKGVGGVSGFIIEKGTPGLSISRKIDKMGLRTSPMGEVILEDCEVPAENLIGKEGMGASIFTASMEWERTCILASQLGAMQRLFETCVRYAKDRRQFGQPIGKFQAVGNKLAEMEVRLETARLVLYKAAWFKSQGKHALAAASIAKLHVSEVCVHNCLDAIQIHGGYGYMTEFNVERELRDAIAGTLYSGTSEIQKLIIAGLRGL
jgi:L-prolyl-PCP dehydrogenase